MSRLERWSRKKRGVESDEADAALDNPPNGSAEPNSELGLEADALSATSSDTESLDAEASVDDAPPLPGSLDHTLPDPDHLPAGSDFSAFMAPGVSAALRRRALKRLWATGNYNVRDGLDDYDADYRQQLKPMATELAGKLRRWANKAEEAVDRPAEADDENIADDDTTTPPEEIDACTSDSGFVQKTSLDDQSDSSNSKVDECISKE
ncbi:DUF3306 domain-containing protein [Vreelandella alkaliphila]|uniref:DUF3306 domain-containing protein n=1 Tax=Vreelandella alkaliphila TaxID=272774 RepID=A0AAJ2RVZ1_9GAMM|nr:DUF3306 domain-containing protein [Halomonas alkaliphila]MDX5977434.1 DUF3306 domain-containing protein [Halomonas alkaliphila]